jgi:hypothetical protein
VKEQVGGVTGGDRQLAVILRRLWWITVEVQCISRRTPSTEEHQRKFPAKKAMFLLCPMARFVSFSD